MHANKEFILVPYWVHQTLERNGCKLADVLNLDTVRPLFSTNDLAGLLALQSKGEHCTGASMYSSTLFMSWSNTVCDDNRAFLSNVIDPLSNDESVAKELHARLFDADSKQEEYTQPFITYDISPEVGAVVLYPGFFTEHERTAHRYSLVTALLKLLYVYMPYNQGAKSPLFNVYLELLSSRKIMV